MSQTIKQKQVFSLNFNWVTMLASQLVDFVATTGRESQEKTRAKIFANPLKNFHFKLNRFSKIAGYLKKHPARTSLAVFFLVILTLLIYKVSTKSSGSIPLINSRTQTNFSPSEQILLNKTFEIAIKTAKGEATGNNLKFALTTADRSKRILIQGKPATARDTKIFIILNFEIENSTKDQLTVKPVDLIRLIDTQGRSFAPDVHNNDVTVEPISIKKTRVGFVIDENQNNFKFNFGEISGTKETIEVNL